MSNQTLQLSWKQLQTDPSIVIRLIKQHKIGVIPTDTLYGIVGSALSQTAVEKIYHARARSLNKPMIILISSVEDLKLFNILLSPPDLKQILQLWPNPVSIILPTPDPKLEYLHRGTKSLAFRIPKDPFLRIFLKQTGPLVAPSANPEGQPPAKNISEAYEYFKDSAQFFIDAGHVDSPPSTIVSINDGILTIKRQGAWRP